jgi:hypothetical protein
MCQQKSEFTLANRSNFCWFARELFRSYATVSLFPRVDRETLPSPLFSCTNSICPFLRVLSHTDCWLADTRPDCTDPSSCTHCDKTFGFWFLMMFSKIKIFFVTFSNVKLFAYLTLNEQKDPLIMPQITFKFE